MVISPKQTFQQTQDFLGYALQEPNTEDLSWLSPCTSFHGECSPGADAQLSTEPTVWGDDSPSDYLTAQMSMEDGEKLLSLRKEINLQKRQVLTSLLERRKELVSWRGWGL